MAPATNPPLQMSLSALDEARFGIPSARASEITAETLPKVLDFCRAHSVAFLIARCRVDHTDCAQAMERAGFELMGTLVYSSRDLKQTPIPPDTGEFSIRLMRPGEEARLKDMAAEAFHGYFGHYHADPRLDPAKCDEVYVAWAAALANAPEAPRSVLVASWQDEWVGFAANRLNSPEEGEGILAGVVPQARRRGVHRDIMINRMKWCLAQGAERMIISTQIRNVAAQKVWVRLGFEPRHACYTFHKWFD